MIPLYIQARVAKGRRLTCADCRKKYTARLRHPSKCLTCDCRERTGAGETAAQLGVRFDLPAWLFAALISEAASEAGAKRTVSLPEVIQPICGRRLTRFRHCG